MSGTVPAERSSSPGWGKWLLVTLLFLAGVLLAGFITLAHGAGNAFLIMLLVSLLLATLLLPVWAIVGLDETEH